MNRNDFTVGFFLARRYVRGANIWTTLLITFVMMLTFLNLTVIGGILEGIVVGSFEGLRDRAIGDVFISPKDGKEYVGRTQHLMRDIRADVRVAAASPRYGTSVEIITEGDFHNVTNANDRRKSINTTAIGVDPDSERMVTNLPDSMIEGEYFSDSGVRRELLMGSALLDRYSPFGADVLSEVYPGDYVYVRIGSSAASGIGFDADDDRQGRDVSGLGRREYSSEGVLQKYLVRGVYRTKAGELDLAVMMNDDEVRLSGKNPENNVSSIALRLVDPSDSVALRDDLLGSGFDRYAKIETVEDAIGPFLDDIRTVFKVLGSVVGAIGLAVSSITIFIIIFVTAISRSKFIGILKAIGITPNAIRISYILYAMFFAIIGTAIGLAILYFLLVPFFDANPIPFPFSDGILYVTPVSVTVQVVLLLLTTFIAGLIPAHRVVRRPAIAAVRGR